MRLFLNFLDSMLEEQNFKMNLLVLEVYGILIDRLKGKVKPHLRRVLGFLQGIENRCMSIILVHICTCMFGAKIM